MNMAINLVIVIFLVKMSWVRAALVNRIHGVHIHVDPMVALDGMKADDAVMLLEGSRSLLELLFHIVYWMEFSLELMKGKIGEHSGDSDWDIGGESWDTLVERARSGFSMLEFMAENWELDRTVRVGDGIKTTVGAELMGVVQHTSYHIGQFVAARKALGLWDKE